MCMESSSGGSGVKTLTEVDFISSDRENSGGYWLEEELGGVSDIYSTID